MGGACKYLLPKREKCRFYSMLILSVGCKISLRVSWEWSCLTTANNSQKDMLGGAKIPCHGTGCVFGQIFVQHTRLLHNFSSYSVDRNINPRKSPDCM